MKKSKGKLLIAVLCLILGACCVLGFASCESVCENHTYGEWEVTKSATCTEAGSKTRKCTTCGETEVSTIDALGHDWIPATCTTPKTCKNCSETEGDVGTHTYDKEVVNENTLKTAATCTAKAVYYKSCVCGEISAAETFEYGDPLGHDLPDTWTKGEGDNHVKKCRREGCTYSKEENCSGGTATCTEKATCTVCGEKYGEVNSTNHDYDWVSNGDGTHTEVCSRDRSHKGETENCSGGTATCTEKANCAVCGEKYGTSLGHDLPDAWTKGEGDNHVKKCQREGCTYSEEENCSGGTATCVEKATCEVCGGKYGEVNSTNHNYKWVSNGNGTHTEVCSRDGSHKGATENCSGSTATCTEKANCAVCGEKYGTSLGHDLPDAWTKGEGDNHVKKCQREGCTYSEEENCSGGTATCVEKATCEVCGGKYGEVNSTNHDYKWVSNGNGTHTEVCSRDESHKGATENCSGGTATCTEKATCTVCGDKYGEVDPTNHKFDKEVIKDEALKTPATCTTEAVYYKSCVCGEISDDDGQTFLGEKIPHTYDRETVKPEALKTYATCTAKAVYYKSCVCGAVGDAETFEYGDTADHAFTVENTEAEGALKTPATCTEAAVYYKSCSVCGKVSTEETDTFRSGETVPHKYDSETVKDSALRASATCTEAAVYYKSCSVCGKVSTEEADTFVSGDKLGHAYVYNTTEPTCTASAVRTTTCERCDYLVKEEVGSELGHDPDDVTTTEELVNGCEYVMVRECKRCGEAVKGETVYHHNYVATITTYPTCSKTGEKTLTCSDCGDTKTEEIEIDTNGHNWVKGEAENGRRTDTCSICNTTKTVTVYEGEETGSTNAGDLKDTDVELNDAGLSFDDGVIDTIGDQDITIAAKKYTGEEAGLTPEQLEQVKDSPVYNFTINNGAISQFGENNYVTVTIPYTLAAGEDVDSIAIWFIGDTGLESIKATYNVDANGNGYVTFKTNHFSYYTVTRLTPAERCELYGHGYSVQHVDGSCTEDSYDLYVCVRCHDKYIDNIKKAEGHKYTTERKEATCTENGYILKKCTECEYGYITKLNATGHKWSVAEHVDSTCSVNGYDKFRCDNCDGEYSVTYEKTAHDFTETVTDPTCEKEGYTLHSCKNCDYNYKSNYVAALKHAYKDASWVWADDFTSAKLTIVCANDKNHVLKLNANIGTTVTRSVCSDYVKTTYIAAVSYNGVIYSDEREKEEGAVTHAFSTEWKSDGTKHWRECVCGEKTDIANHAYDEVVVTKEATCVSNGEKAAYCVCGKTKTTVIPATGEHKYVNGVCETCGKAEGSCDHKELHKVTVNLAEYGACGGYLYYETCACGEVKIFDTTSGLDMDCNFAKMEESQGDPYVDDDGNMCMEMSSRCPACGLELKGFAKQLIDGCEAKIVAWYTLSVKGEIIAENLFAEIGSMGEQHEYEDVTVDLAEYGACGGVMKLEKCSVCGKINGIKWTTDIKCKIDLTEPTPEKITDENGIVHTVQQVVCPDCGLRFVMDMWTIDESACVKHMYGAQRIIIGDTVVYEYTQEQAEENHNMETTYKMYGETCEDGVKITQRCSVCGYTEIWYTSQHDEAEYEFDLSEFGGCKGTITGRRCNICEKMTYVDDMKIGCTFKDSVTKEETDENGVVHKIMESVCSTCGLKFVQEMWQIQESECVTHNYGTLIIYKGDEVIFDCTMKQTAEKHQYEYEYEKLGETCNDGYKVKARCSVCGRSYEYTSSGHVYKDVEIDIKEKFGGCGGLIVYTYCPICGEILRYQNVKLDCDITWNSEAEEKVVDGVTHYVTTGGCKTCGLSFVREMWEIAESECRKTQYVKLSIYRDNELLIDITDNYTHTEHDFTYEYKLLGKTCEDGYILKGTCSRCGEVVEDRRFGHMIEDFAIDLADYDGCGGILAGTRCRVCNKITYIYKMDIRCNTSGSTTDSTYTKDGIEHAVSEITCSECGLRFVADVWKVVKSDCETYEYTNMLIYRGEELILDYTNENYIDSHEYEYTYELTGKTCEDGYKVIKYCHVCGNKEEWTDNGHRTDKFTLNLAEYNGCEGTLSGEHCVVCKKIMYFDIESLARISCEIGDKNPDGVSKEEVTDDDKIAHTITTMRCSKCVLVFVQDAWTIAESPCETNYYNKITIYSGDDVIFEYVMIQSEINHNMEYSFKFDGKTCADGVDVTEYCTVCDFRKIYYTKGHVEHDRKTDLGELGLCGGIIYDRYCIACGEITYSEVNEYCKWVSVDKTENGYLYRCDICKAEKQVSETVGDKDENCNFVRTVSTVYYKDGKEIYKFERSYTETIHNFKPTFELQGKSCTDGYIITYTCEDCKFNYTDRRNSHDMFKVFAVEGETACGNYHDIWFIECPCGLEYSYNFNSEGLVLDEESGTYRCDECNLTLKVSTYVAEDGCSVTASLIFEAQYGDVNFTRTESNTYANHEFKTVEVKTANGKTSLVSICEKCKQTRETNTMSGTPENHDKEEYYFDYRVTPETSGMYAIFGLSDEDTFVTLYKENNGKLEEIARDDDGFVNRQFLLNTYLEAGNVYVYRIKYLSGTDTTPIDFAFSASSDSLLCRHGKSVEFRYLPDGVTSCEDGARVGDICLQCGMIKSLRTITSHERMLISTIELSKYGTCNGGYVYEYSCVCGKEHYFDLGGDCANNYSENKYYDDDGKLVCVEVISCSKCGLRFEKRYYTVKDTENCTLTYYYTVLITVGNNAVYNTEYTVAVTSHDYDVTYTLKNGKGSSCFDGVLVSKKCKDCGAEDNYEIKDHEIYEVERVDLSDVCGGYAIIRNCACGTNGHVSLENTLCEFDTQNTSVWIENIVSGSYMRDAFGEEYFDNYAYIKTCAVTDPTACGYKIRYAEYWLKAPNECVAYQYGTWQFGYNEKDGTYVREITFRMKGFGTYHNYEDKSEDENHQRFECAACGSYYYINREFDENGSRVSQETYSYNGVTTETRKQIYRYDGTGEETFERNEYGKNGEITFWAENIRTYEEYTATFGDSGRKTFESYKNSNNEDRSNESAYVSYKGYEYCIYRYNKDGDYWYRYDYSYEFNPCKMTITYTDSSGENRTRTEDNCRFYERIDMKDSTCTQDGEVYDKCVICGKLSGAQTISPYDHDWCHVENGNYYYCTRCGIENINGASGSIIMEDLTAKYGNGENYVVGYYARNDVNFDTYVSLILAGGEEIVIPDIEFIEIKGVRAFAFGKAQVAAWAAAKGYTDYDVRFSFVPKGGDSSFDYGVTFTDEAEIGVISEATNVKEYFADGEAKTYTITLTEDALLNIRIYSEYEFNCELTDSNGEILVSGWMELSTSLKAGETYTLKISCYKTNLERYMVFGIEFNDATAE